jgi:hypothetical protein
VLIIQDTTELNLETHRKRIKDPKGLGEIGNGTDLGFFCHPTIVVNPRDGGLMGGIDIRLFARKRDKDEKGDYIPKGKHSGRQVGIEEKESYRWIIGGIAAKERLGTAGVKGVTVVQDREGDIYESFCLLSEAGVDFVIRVNHDRTVRDDEHERKKLGEHLDQLSVAYEYRMRVGKKGEKPREARLEVKYGNVRLERPGHIGGGGSKYAKEQHVFVVQVQEHEQTIPPGKQGIQWRLYTSHEVKSREDAEKIIEYYRKRWIIEDLFRTLKTKGLNYETSELESGKALRSLFVLAFMGAVQILQLRQARKGQTEQKTSLIFSGEHEEFLEELVKVYEGKTEKQKNPWPKTNLAWASWIIGRLGGWKGYVSQRPPGVITLHEGMTRFYALYQGWLLAKRCV